MLYCNYNPFYSLTPKSTNRPNRSSCHPVILANATPQHVVVQLPAQSDSWFIIRAPGYQEWKLRFHYSLQTSRKLTGPVRLQRMPVKEMIT